jgi:hypothetical protein
MSSFPWWEPAVPEEYRRTFSEKFERMILEDARRRAQILRALGYERAYARMRVRGNVLWEFEKHKLPAVAKRVEEVVDEVYAR